MKPCIFFFFSILFLATACNNNNITKTNIQKIKTILVDDKYSDAPALKLVRYVKLETSNECLLEDAQKVIVYKNKIYILSSFGAGNVYVFNIDGKYVTRINKGEGPKDIMYPTDIAINEENNTLAILDAYRNIKEFSLENYNFSKKSLSKKLFFH